MSNVRLSKYSKDTILKRLLKHAFSEREAEHEKKQKTFGSQVYNAVYDKKTRDAMARLPEGFLITKPYISVSFEGIGWDRCSYGENRVIAHNHIHNAARVFEADHPLCVKYRELKNQRTQIEEDKKIAEMNIKAVLDSANTLKQLLDLWPEVTPFVEDFVVTKSANSLPAIPFQELNKTLNLKKVKKQ